MRKGSSFFAPCLFLRRTLPITCDDWNSIFSWTNSQPAQLFLVHHECQAPTQLCQLNILGPEHFQEIVLLPSWSTLQISSKEVEACCWIDKILKNHQSASHISLWCQHWHCSSSVPTWDTELLFLLPLFKKCSFFENSRILKIATRFLQKLAVGCWKEC